MEKKSFDILKERGYVYQATNEEKIKEMLNTEESKTFYLGIDPTAIITLNYFNNNNLIIQKGKKQFRKIILN